MQFGKREYRDKDSAFSAFYDEYIAFVLSQARRYCARPEDVQDVAQEVFLHAAKRFDGLIDAAKPQILKYLALCTKGRALNMKRGEDIDWLDPDADIAQIAIEELDTERVLMNKETLLQVYRAVQNLPEIYRIVLELRLSGMAAQEIADILGLPRKTVYKRIERGCQKIRERIRAEDEA